MIDACIAGLRRAFGVEAQPVLGEARLADADRLAAIHAEGFERGWDAHEFERLLQESTVSCQVLRPGGHGAPLGFVLSRIALDEAEVLTVAVCERCRGRGLGAVLLGEHLGRLAARRVREVFLEVAEDNTPAIRLYRAHGFVEVGRRRGYYRRAGGEAVTAIVMRRALA